MGTTYNKDITIKMEFKMETSYYKEIIKLLKYKMDIRGLLAFGLIILLAASVNAVTTTAPTNMVVDFDSTSFDSSLSPGDSGILNLVIMNTGGYKAEEIDVYIPSTAKVSVDKKFFIGSLDAGASKTLPIVVRIPNDAATGLTSINVKINYNGFRYTGQTDNDMQTSWNIPIRIYGNPLFQLEPSQIRFYKDNIDRMEFAGTLQAPVDDLEATLSSSCFTVMGSSKKYLGDMESENDFSIEYQIKPTSEGACTANVYLEYLDESGTSAGVNLTFGLNVEASGVDMKITDISYEPTGPGEIVKVKIGIKNVGRATADETTVSLDISEPFVPIETAEKYIGPVKAGETIDVTFDLALTWDAAIQAYAIPLTIDYKIGGTSYTVEKDIGIDVTGKIILEVINVEQRSGTVRVDVANIEAKVTAKEMGLSGIPN